MRELVIALTKIVTDITSNPYLKFIIKKNSETQKIKAYKKLTIELYLHMPGKNIKCVEYSRRCLRGFARTLPPFVRRESRALEKIGSKPDQFV